MKGIPVVVRHIVSSFLTLVVFGAFVVFAWTGPTASPPNNNVDAPINVGTTDQIKDAGLGVDVLAVYGNAYVENNLGIGDATPSYPLDVTGDIHNVGNMYSDGYFHNSDERLKTAIKTISGLEIVAQLRGVSFSWKKDGTPSAGVIAQEVEAVLPEAVHSDAEGFKSVNYDALIAPLIEAVKEQQQEIDALKKEVELLKQSTR